MKITDKECRNYLKQVRKLLICKREERIKFINTLSDSIEEFINANPDADFEKLQEVLGTPQEIAESLIKNESVKNIKKSISIAKLFMLGVIVVVLIYAVIFIAATIRSVTNAKRDTGKVRYLEYTVSANCNEYNTDLTDYI